MSKDKDRHEQGPYLFDVYGSRENEAREFEAAKERREEKMTTVPPLIMQLKMQQDSGVFFGKGKVFRKSTMSQDPPNTTGRFIDESENGRFAIDSKLPEHPVGQATHQYVGKPQNMDGHIAVLGGTGSGKGTCVAFPTMRSWGENPMVVLDVKGDLYSQWEKMNMPNKRPAKVFNPAEDYTSTYDPFSYIKSDAEDNRVSNLRELVGAIIPLSADGKNQFWDKAARKILTGAWLYYLDLGKSADTEKEIDFYTAIDYITSSPLEELFTKINSSDNLAARKYIRSFSGKDDLTDSEMLMDINETLDTYLMEFVNDMRIKKALASSDNPSNVINWETDINTHNIFLTIPEDKIDQWGSVLRMMLTQLVRSLERRPDRYSPEGESLSPVLLLLDEFPRIGKMDVLANALSTLRSKNVTILLLAQSLNQISALYGLDVSRVMIDNCSFKAVLRVDSPDNQRYFSELAGTVPTQSKSHSSNHSDTNTSYGESYTESREPFVRPEELAHLDKELILYTPFGTYRVEKVPYHDCEQKAKIFGAE